MKKIINIILGVILLLGLSGEVLAAKDAVLSFAAPSSVKVNSTFTVSVKLNGGSNTTITTATTYFHYNPSHVALQGSVSFSSGSFPIAYHNVVNTGAGGVELSASSNAPVGGASLTVATFTMKALKVGTTTITWDNKSKVLLNDITNTNVLSSMIPATITITDGGGGGGGGGGSDSHLGCFNGQCIRVAGRGSDECRNNSDCLGSGGGGGGLGQCETPYNFRGVGAERSIQLSWNNNDSRVSGYDIRYGTTSGNYTNTAHTGNIDALTLTGLQSGRTYYMTITSMGDCLASDPSGELAVATIGGSTGVAHPALPKKTNKSGVGVEIPLAVMAGSSLLYVLRKKFKK